MKDTGLFCAERFHLKPVRSEKEGKFCFEIVSEEVSMTRSVRRKLEISVKQKGEDLDYEGSVEEHKVYRFQVEAVPATVTVEVKYDGSHVRGSPYTQPHVEEKAEDLMKDLSVEMDDNSDSVGNTSPGPSLVSDRFISTSSNLQTTGQRKDPGSNRSVDVSGRGAWRQQMIIKSVSGGGSIDGAQGLCVLRSGSIVVADKKDQVLMFDSDGKFVKKVLGEQGRGFNRPGDMTRLHNGDFVLKDKTGIQKFNGRGIFLSRLWTNRGGWQCYGLAEDEKQILWFIDVNERNREARLKRVDLKTGLKLRSEVSLTEVIGKSPLSKCRFLTFAGSKLYITDLGLDHVYVLDPEKVEEVERFGGPGTGEGQFSDPAGVGVDQAGNILVADSRNHRICLLDMNGNWLEKVPLSPAVRRPSAVLLDKEDLYCLNLHGSNALVKYKYVDL